MQTAFPRSGIHMGGGGGTFFIKPSFFKVPAFIIALISYFKLIAFIFCFAQNYGKAVPFHKISTMEN